MNKTYEERLKLKTVYDLLAVLGMIVLLTGVLGFMGVVGHSEVEFLVPTVPVWKFTDYLFYTLLSVVVALVGHCFYRLGSYGSYVQNKVLRKMEKSNLW